jgi:hypothetical protein
MKHPRKSDLDFMDSIIRGGKDEADFTMAILEGVQLQGAKVTPKQLMRAEKIMNITLPDGKKYKCY